MSEHALPLPLTIPCEGIRLIEASAGTGKTYTIASLYLRLLLEDERRSVRDLLVVTFTVAATQELRDRIRARLRAAHALLQDEAALDAETDVVLKTLVQRVDNRDRAARRLADALTCIDEAAVFTIHGFCQRVLQENAFESGALFEAEFITDESELLIEVVRDFWRRRFYGADAGLAALAAEQWGTPDGLRDAIRHHLARADLRVLPAIDAASCDEAAWAVAAQGVGAAWRESRAEVIELLANDPNLGRAQGKTYHADDLAAAVDALDAWTAEAMRSYALPDRFVLFTPDKLRDSLKPAKAKAGTEPPDHPFFHRCQSLMNLRTERLLQLTADAIAWCRDELVRRKREAGVLSFNDLLRELSAALEGEGGDALAVRIAARFPVALIDEFQDTDPEQYHIFARVYGHAPPGGALFMIGDPKQAIYSFRGADVFTYMEAKRGTVAAARHSLDTNWRSSQRLVSAVNALFQHAHAPFIYDELIGFHPVNAAGKADKKPLHIDGVAPTPLQAWFVPRPEDKTISKEWAKSHLSAACAAEVVRLLNADTTVGDERLLPADIAVLVRDHFEAEAVQRALRAVGVASVYYSRDSVYASDEADDLQRLLFAVADPADERALRAALCTPLLGTTAAELDALLRDELAWEALLGDFHAYHADWTQHGFMAMFRRLLHGRGIAARLLAQAEGERRLTNLLQLGELLQQASREHHGVEHLLRWFAEQRAAPNGDSEEQQLRLESDEALVKIVTIHKSKGLEYPVVFLPFLWGCKPTRAGPVLVHEDGIVLHLDPDDAHYAQAEQERLAEELRLLYVALTRAEHLCYFAWGAFRDADASGLAWLLHGSEERRDVAALAQHVRTLDDAQLRARLDALAQASSGALCVTDLPHGGDRYRVTAEVEQRLAAREASRTVGASWRITSYTALASGRTDAAERPDHGGAAEDADGEGVRARSIFQFPKGARAGTFMHELLERLDFPEARGEALTREVRRMLARHGFSDMWQSTIERLVGDTLDAPLGDGLSLRQVRAERRVNELEFHYPMARIEPGALDRIAEGLGGFHSERAALRFAPVAGMMRGFIDLVFAHEGRFFLADYKSSWLGARQDDYRRERMSAAVAQHRYDLQYLLYTLALHRHLRARVAGYDYERHFGGVYYLFLRGLSPERADTGVYFDRPAYDVIDALDALMGGRRA